MKLSRFLVVKSIISLIFGFAMVLVPAGMMSVYGITLDFVGTLMTQLVGACLIGIGLICWLCRYSDRSALQGITISLFVGDSIAFFVVLLGQFSGFINVFGWVNVAIWLFLALGLAYYSFLSPK